MPGNENSDTVHNFFHQGNLSQNQQHTRAVEGNWNVLNNNPWGVSDRQNSGPFTSKNYNAHQSDNERAQGNQFALGSYGSNFTQSNPRQEFFKIQSQNHPPNLNGFNHAPEVSYTRQNEASNIMGMATESDQVHPSSRGFHMLDSQHRSGLQHSNSNSSGFRTVDSRVNFDFLGNQQQMTGQQAGPLLSMQSQQSGVGDMQQMQQQLMLKQMQELQRQHQLQQLEALRRNSLNQMSSMPNQRISHPSTLGSETSMHDGQSFPWQSPVMVGNPNWLQHGAHAAMQGYSNGVMITPEQGQALRMMGLVPQPGSHSLYGVPVSSPRAASPLHGQVDRPGMHQASVQNSSLSSNRHALFPEQSAIREGSDLPNSGFENKGSFQEGFGPGSGDADNVGFLNQNQQRNVVREESGGKLDLTCSFETFPEKTVRKHDLTCSSQAAVALDPTEEKILFGSDDNIWEAFGGSLTTAAGSNNNTDAAFPSLQSGTWSALMQSAVAESDSSTVPPHEGWNGVGVHNSGSLATNVQNSFSQDSARHQVAWTDDSQAALRSKSVADNASIGHNTGSTSLPSFLNQRPSQQARSSQQSSQEGRNWLDNTVQSHGEGRQVENIFSSAELNSKGPTGHSGHQPNMFSQGSQLINTLNAFIVESSQQNGFMTAKALHVLDHDRAINTNVGHTGPFLTHDSASNANVGFSGPKYNRNDGAANHNPSIAKVNQDTGQLVSENHSYNFWRTVNSTQQENNESKNHQSVRSPQVLDSSLNSSVRGGSEIRETGNADRRENFHDSHSFNVSHHSPSDSFRDNASSDISNMHLPGQKQTLSSLGGSKGLGPRKFQYHPMGVADMDGELVNRQKHPIYSEAMPHPFHEGFANQERQSIFSHPGLGKGLAPKNHVDERASYGHASSTSYSYQGHAPVASTSEKQTQSSQNMLELLHKVDQSDEQNSAKQLSSSMPTDIPEGEVSGGTVRHPKQSSGSQSFGLQLAPPSLGLPAPNFTLAGENSFRDDNSSGLNAVHSEDKANAWLPPGASFQSMPPLQQALDRGPWNEKSGSPGHLYAESLPSDISRESKGVGNSTVFASGSGYSRSHLHSQRLTDAGGKMSDNQNRQLADVSATSTSQRYLSNDLASQREVSQPTNSEQYDARTSVNQTPPSAISASSQPSVMYDAAANTNLASVAKPGNYVTQQHLSNQFMNASNLYMSRQHINNSMEAHLSSQKEQDSKDPREGGSTINSHAIVRREESSERITDAGVKIGNSVSESAATQKEIEAFGRSLRPKSHVPDDSSMLQHVQAVKDVEGDDTVRHMKRLKGSDTGPTAGQMYSGGTNFVIKDPSASIAPVTDGDAKKLDVTPEACNSHVTGRPLQVQHDNALMEDKLSVSQNLSGTTTPRFEHPPQISPQMAPTWLDQFGSIKNEQMLPGHDAHKSPSISSLQQQFMISSSKNFIADQSTCQLNVAVRTDQIANSQHATPLIPGNLIFPPHPLASGALPQVPDSPRAKKRKSATDLVPWYKEVALGSYRVQSLSSAPMEWARAVNRLIEKPEDELDMSGDMMLVNRSRRRLIQTTQLMQQLLRPPPAGIMSLDASSNYETVTYFLARLALGDACSMACCMASNSHMNNGSSLSGKPMTSGRMRDQYLSKLAEDFTNRAKKLEDMLRLDKQALTLDLRLECQDLERLSVINRFAKFHGRGQADGVETSSSSNPAAITPKPVPQRYVSAFPMPKNLPDGIQCLSL